MIKYLKMILLTKLSHFYFKVQYINNIYLVFMSSYLFVSSKCETAEPIVADFLVSTHTSGQNKKNEIYKNNIMKTIANLKSIIEKLELFLKDGRNTSHRPS